MVQNGHFSPQPDIRVVGENPEVHGFAFVAIRQRDFVPWPALKLAPPPVIKGAVLVEQLTPQPDLNDNVQTVDIERRRIPFAFWQVHPEPDMLLAFTARRV